MTACSIGRLPIGPVPRVVGTVSRAETLLTLPPQPPRADIVEVRLDLVGPAQPDWLEHCRAIEAAGRPVILTLRSTAEGGNCAVDDPRRIGIYSAALDALSTIDVEWNHPLRESLCRRAAERGKPVIVSYHDFQSTPSADDLEALLERMLAEPVAIPKIAAMVRDAADQDTLRRVLAVPRTRPVCLIGMGAVGADTRWQFPALGSCLTYGFIDASSAPGQWPADVLVDKLGALLPAYAAERRAHKG